MLSYYEPLTQFNVSTRYQFHSPSPLLLWRVCDYKLHIEIRIQFNLNIQVASLTAKVNSRGLAFGVGVAGS